MKRSVLLGVLLPAAIVLALAGCGGGSGGGNSAPVANAGKDQASGVLAGDAVVLDGSASSDPDGDALTYSWSLTSMPPDSTAALNDSSSDKPEFVADKAGTYVAQLIVNDGKTDSASSDVTITVAVAPPTVTIKTPEPLTLFTANPANVSGTVDDPQAAITVNGAPTPNNNGSYSADVTLAEGGNTVTVVATNGSGAGNASVDVVLKTKPGPVMSITSPRPGFTAGVAWDGVGASPTNDIPAQVNGTITTDKTSGTPTVMVYDDANGPPGVTATLSPLATNPILAAFCKLFPNAAACKSLDSARYSFSATLHLSKGSRTITADGSDTLGGSTELKVSGVADYCLEKRAEKDNLGNDVAALRGDHQNNRCHEIDGCSDGTGAAADSPRDMPMGPQSQYALTPVKFGWGTMPPSEYFVHGQSSQYPFGCNIHDTCYQTCVPPGVDRIAAWHNCNVQQLGNHKAMCRRAYPAKCPFTTTGLLGNTIPDPVKCIPWAAEKAECFALANVYFAGVEGAGEFAYNTDQNEHCLP